MRFFWAWLFLVSHLSRMIIELSPTKWEVSRFSAMSMMALITGFLVGILADRTDNVRRIVLVLNLVQILGNLMYFVGQSPWMLIAGRALVGKNFIAVLSEDVHVTFLYDTKTSTCLWSMKIFFSIYRIEKKTFPTEMSSWKTVIDKNKIVLKTFAWMSNMSNPVVCLCGLSLYEIGRKRKGKEGCLQCWDQRRLAFKESKGQHSSACCRLMRNAFFFFFVCFG